jgi:CubicO group peptidase (beta-lactamase class C family)
MTLKLGLLIISQATRIVLLSCLAALLVGCSKSSELSSEEPLDGLQYVTPEEVGWSSEKLDTAKQFAQQSGYAAVMAAYDGNVFFSWGEVSRDFYVHSIRKPFLSALYGIHVNRGEIDLNQRLEQLAIDDIPPSLTSAEKQATIRELLQSRSGVYHEAAAEDSSMMALRPARGAHPHGTFYYYNNWGFNVAGTIFRQKTMLDIFEAFDNEIAGPIGMQDFSTSNCFYQYEYNKSQHPAYVFRMSARDMTRFGVLFQKGGVWLGDQIIPPAWITESTTTYSVIDSVSGFGYGYMWRTIPAGTVVAQMAGSSGFYHTGAGVHAVIILPELKLVVVERVNTDGPTWVDPGEAGLELGLMIINARN